MGTVDMICCAAASFVRLLENEQLPHHKIKCLFSRGSVLGHSPPGGHTDWLRGWCCIRTTVRMPPCWSPESGRPARNFCWSCTGFSWSISLSSWLTEFARNTKFLVRILYAAINFVLLLPGSCPTSGSGWRRLSVGRLRWEEATWSFLFFFGRSARLMLSFLQNTRVSCSNEINNNRSSRTSLTGLKIWIN